jgi:hypothetical protein
MEVEPGAEAQVDFGQDAWVMVDGKRKRPGQFRIVLNHSRKGYREAVSQQMTEIFLRPLTAVDGSKVWAFNLGVESLCGLEFGGCYLVK